jgi:hypothetical protein
MFACPITRIECIILAWKPVNLQFWKTENEIREIGCIKATVDREPQGSVSGRECSYLEQIGLVQSFALQPPKNREY